MTQESWDLMQKREIEVNANAYQVMLREIDTIKKYWDPIFGVHNMVIDLKDFMTYTERHCYEFSKEEFYALEAQIDLFIKQLEDLRWGNRMEKGGVLKAAEFLIGLVPEGTDPDEIIKERTRN